MVSSFVAVGVVCVCVGVFIVILSLIFLDFVVVFNLFICLFAEERKGAWNWSDGEVVRILEELELRKA